MNKGWKKRTSLKGDKELWFSDVGPARKRSAMLLPISEVLTEEMEKEEDLGEVDEARREISVYIEGEIGRVKELFYRLIEEGLGVQRKVMDRVGDGGEETKSPYSDSLISILKGLDEDIHGNIVDELTSPIPFVPIEVDEDVFDC